MGSLELAPDVRAQLDEFEAKLGALERALLPLRDATPAQVDAACCDPLDRARAHLALSRTTEALSGAGLALRGGSFEEGGAAEAQRERLDATESRLERVERERRRAEAGGDEAGWTPGGKSKRSRAKRRA